MSSKRVSQIFKILLQTRDINNFVLRGVFLVGMFFKDCLHLTLRRDHAFSNFVLLKTDSVLMFPFTVMLSSIL